MRDHDAVPPTGWRRSPPQPGAPAPTKVAWPSTADADWLRDLHSYDGFVRPPRPD
jgi:hypothetical protein